MEPYEKLALKSWGFQYAPETMAVLREHYAEVFDRWKDVYKRQEQAVTFMGQIHSAGRQEMRLPERYWRSDKMDLQTCLKKMQLVGVLAFATVDSEGAPQIRNISRCV